MTTSTAMNDASTTTQHKPKPAKKKKKKISKHVLESQKLKLDGDEKNSAPKTTKRRKRKQKEKNTKTKDPKEAAKYLQNWKDKNSGNEDTEWKFNKNDQSWLIRHMYSSNMVSKGTFSLLLEYLSTAADSTKTRIREDATSKALRYKEWEKNNSDEKGGNDEATASDAKEDSAVVAGGDDADDEEARWKKLDSHEKRKEYKRARKILDEVK